jgi:hypothetical protein
LTSSKKRLEIVRRPKRGAFSCAKFHLRSEGKMNYREKSAQLAIDSTVAFYVLSSPDGADTEFCQLKPRPMNAREAEELRDRWHGRNLDSVGVIGLVGTVPRCELKAPLGPERESRLMSAFLDHLHGVFCDSIAEQQESANIETLHRWLSMPDTRPN